MQPSSDANGTSGIPPSSISAQVARLQTSNRELIAELKALKISSANALLQARSELAALRLAHAALEGEVRRLAGDAQVFADALAHSSARYSQELAWRRHAENELHLANGQLREANALIESRSTSEPLSAAPGEDGRVNTRRTFHFVPLPHGGAMPRIDNEVPVEPKVLPLHRRGKE